MQGRVSAHSRRLIIPVFSAGHWQFTVKEEKRRREREKGNMTGCWHFLLKLFAELRAGATVAVQKTRDLGAQEKHLNIKQHQLRCKCASERHSTEQKATSICLNPCILVRNYLLPGFIDILTHIHPPNSLLGTPYLSNTAGPAVNLAFVKLSRAECRFFLGGAVLRVMVRDV